MEGNTGEIHIESERELYKYIGNHHAGTPTNEKSKNQKQYEYIYTMLLYY